MKINFRICLISLFLPFAVNTAFGQQADVIKDELKKSESIVKAIRNKAQLQQMLLAAKKMFEWKVQENDNAYMLTVDIPYPNIQKPKDYFSMTVVKFKGKKRPRVISFAVSSMIDPSKGLDIYFSGYNKNKSIKMSNIMYEDLPFTDINKEYIKVSAEYMYLDKNKKKDLLEPMFNNNHMVFQFYDHDGKPYKISYPLLWFKDQIEKLE